jgi:hypothetical protein
MAPVHPGWSVDGEGRGAWPVNRYFVEGQRTTGWISRGVVKRHRTIATTLNTLIRAGYTIRQIDEWAPTADQVAAIPDLAEELERPMLLLVSARR